MDAGGVIVKGTCEAVAKDEVWKFTPTQPWKAQHYKVQVKAMLEDLAGNNLNRVFDRDITKDIQKSNMFYEKPFEIKP